MIAAWCALLLWTQGGPVEQAERAYRLGDFAAARAAYLVALAQPGEHRGALWCNVGNCEYRLGEVAAAALDYRRALRWRPGDARAIANLRRCQQQLGVALEPLPGPRGVDGNLLSAAVLLPLLGGWLARRRQAPPQRTAGLLLLLVGIGAGAAAAVGQWGPRPLQGVALKAVAPGVPDGPSLRPGEVWTVLERTPDRVRVQRGAVVGWVAAAAIGVVD